MTDDAIKSNSAKSGDVYRVIRTDTERVVNDLLAVMRHRREDAVDRQLRETSCGPDEHNETTMTEVDFARLTEIKMAHCTGFAHALLQGAVEAFEDQKAGLTFLKDLIEAELLEMEHDASFTRQATSMGSTAIN